VLVSIINNPAKGKLQPASNLFSRVIDGVVNFTMLNIDRSGPEYRLAFELYAYVRKTETYNATGVKAYSEYFDVGVGRAAGLKVDPSFAQDVWAGRFVAASSVT